MKKLSLWLGAITLLLVAGAVLQTRPAHAVGAAGYFGGGGIDITTGGLALPPCGLTGVGHEEGKCSLFATPQFVISDVNTYKQIIFACINFQNFNGCDGTVDHAVGAAFIVETTLHGQQPQIVGRCASVQNCPPAQLARQDWAAFSNLVDSYNARGQVRFEDLDGTLNSGVDTGAHDAGFFQDNFSRGGAIVFTDVFGNPIYAVKLNCGNPFGQANALPALAEQTNLIVQTFVTDQNGRRHGTPDGTIRGCVALLCAGDRTSTPFGPDTNQATVAAGTYPVNVDGTLPASWRLDKITACWGNLNPRCPATLNLGRTVFVGGNFTIVTFEFVKDTTPQPPAKFYPWLQVNNGDVASLGSIFGQALNNGGDHPGGRPAGSVNKEASNIVIASLNPQGLSNQQLYEVGDPVNPDRPLATASSNATAATNFCTSMTNRNIGGNNNVGSYNFGIRSSNGANTATNDSRDPSCTSGVYIQNILPEYLRPAGGNDEIMVNFSQARNNSDDNSKGPRPCYQTDPSNSFFILNQNRPYYEGGFISPNLNGGDLESPLSRNDPFGGRGTCPSVWSLSGNKITGANLTNGTATVLVVGDLEISGNIADTFNQTYPKPYRIPNLGILVEGNVVIDNNVSQVDATIYATGTIKTCNSYGDGSLGQSCRANPLTVHGALLAKGGFFFGRTYTDGSSNPAEHIMGTGQAQFYPPPGFENRFGPSVTTPYILKEDLPVGQ